MGNNKLKLPFTTCRSYSMQCCTGAMYKKSKPLFSRNQIKQSRNKKKMVIWNCQKICFEGKSTLKNIFFYTPPERYVFPGPSTVKKMKTPRALIVILPRKTSRKKRLKNKDEKRWDERIFSKVKSYAKVLVKRSASLWIRWPQSHKKKF